MTVSIVGIYIPICIYPHPFWLLLDPLLCSCYHKPPSVAAATKLGYSKSSHRQIIGHCNRSSSHRADNRIPIEAIDRSHQIAHIRSADYCMQPRPSFAVQQPVCIYIVYYDEKKEEKKIDQSLSFFEFGLAKV